MIYLLLFTEFFKIGLFAVGGGLATLPFLQELAGKYNWYTQADIANMLAISEATPGPIGINMATFVGYHVAGVPGSVLASLAMVLPAVIIVLSVARFLEKFNKNHFVQNGFYGLRPAVAALVSVALFSMLKISLLNQGAQGGWVAQVNIPGLLLLVAMFFAMGRFKKHPIFYIALGAAAGIFLAPG